MPKASSSVPKAKQPKEEKKSKREPSAWNLYVKAQYPAWKEANPGRPFKDAMADLKLQWQDAEENPNKGKPVKPRSSKSKRGAAKDASSEPARSSPGIDGSDLPSSEA
ncbi:hypothetical protein V5O48_012712 [Marasmius crinis-equi]|uniref:HMG box domain-containing protein n=1 Tax=Marasmius crinis-equi TaxID=585013 RepID=A0ABR3F221_9AGAR